MLLIVGHQVREREPIMRCHKVDGGGRRAAALPLAPAVCGPPVGLGGVVLFVEVRGAAQRRCKAAGPGSVCALDELADSVAEGAVPLGPAAAVVGEGTHLVQPITVPRLCNHLGVAQHRVLADDLNERGVRQGGAGGHARAVRHDARLVDNRAARLQGSGVALGVHGLGVPGRGGAGQDGGQVKPESIHVVLLHPVAQAVQDELAHHRVVAVEGVAAPAVVVVLTPRGQHVVYAVVQAPE
mmetsp:Transcript_14565/g.31734  ORF Transcript_14565/g.31734 Transcript_14565/m.31734 type:complete len:240 (+) Transcript_14565:2343-3062(+)